VLGVYVNKERKEKGNKSRRRKGWEQEDKQQKPTHPWQLCHWWPMQTSACSAAVVADMGREWQLQLI
jgi:hypothetical protein